HLRARRRQGRSVGPRQGPRPLLHDGCARAGVGRIRLRGESADLSRVGQGEAVAEPHFARFAFVEPLRGAGWQRESASPACVPLVASADRGTTSLVAVTDGASSALVEAARPSASRGNDVLAAVVPVTPQARHSPRTMAARLPASRPSLGPGLLGSCRRTVVSGNTLDGAPAGLPPKWRRRLIRVSTMTAMQQVA